MPKGKGTYGSKKGRPKKTKMKPRKGSRIWQQLLNMQHNQI